MKARPPADPRVHAFLDRLAEAVAADLLREISAEQSSPTDADAADANADTDAEVQEHQQRAG